MAGPTGVLGNVARGEDSPDSDIDLLVDLPEATSLFAVLALEGRLERTLKVKVDLPPVTSLKARVRAEALADAVAMCRRDPERLQDSLDAIVAINSQVSRGDLSNGLTSRPRGSASSRSGRRSRPSPRSGRRTRQLLT